MANHPDERLLNTWREDIRRNGFKKLKLRTLLDAFGAQRRGAVVLQRIADWCETQGLYANGFDLVGGLDDTVTLSEEPIARVGALAELEDDLCRRFSREIAPKIGRLKVIRENYSPPGSRDRLDFLCQDLEGRPVVVEIKRGDGEKRVVEQVLRYMRGVRRDATYASTNPRGVIVTGEGDLATRRALEELEPDIHIDWYVYGIVDGAIKLQRQTVDVCRASNRSTASTTKSSPATGRRRAKRS